MVFKKSFILVVATTTTAFFAFVSIIFEQACGKLVAADFMAINTIFKKFGIILFSVKYIFEIYIITFVVDLIFITAVLFIIHNYL